MRRGSGPRVAGVAALAVILIAAASVAIVLSGRGGGAPAHARGQHRQHPAPAQGNATANLAASWVDSQISHGAIVACDQAMCDALTAHGFPGRRLQLIRPGAPYPLHSQITVETPVVRAQFGSRNARAAPLVLTSIGAGSAAISIRVVAPDGAAAYEAALKTDMRLRRSDASSLLTSRQVTASPAASMQLKSGQVDARLIVVLTAIASRQQIEILGFGTSFPGASPGVPLRTAYLAQSDPAARMRPFDYLRLMLSTLDAQQGVYHPQTARAVRHGGGKKVFEIGFSAPSPLKLLGG
jgi:hypothetical protein